jgi:hypothetical protein
MGAIIEIYIKAETLKVLSETVSKKGDKGVSITLSVNDEPNQYGQNVSGFVSQTQEQRNAKKEKFYVANGAVKWINENGVKVAVKPQENTPTAALPLSTSEDDLPF